MAAPTYSDIIKFSKSVEKVSKAARQTFEKAVRNVDFSDWTQAAQQLREIVNQVILTYGPAAGELGAQWYEYCRSLNIAGAYTAKLADINQTSIDYGVNSAIDKMFSGEMTALIATEAIAGIVESQVQNQSRETIHKNLEDEYNQALASGNKKLAKKAGFARVTSDSACAFCVMVASQGFHYTSEKTAGEQYHPHCSCVAVPFADAGEIKGYSDRLEKYQKIYDDANSLRKSDDMPEELRERISQAKAEHNAKYKAGEIRDRWSASNETLIVMRWQNDGMH